ncbi:MAG: DNA replication protein, partial [Methanobacteriota archaeon]
TEKEALALQLFGGVPKEMPDGRRIRGDLHVLLVGDPGTGKSELLSYMSRLSPRGIYATGKAASAAGLTAAAVRDEFGEGRWTLEAGALVLADRGLACLHPSTEVFLEGVPTPIAALFDAKTSEPALAGGIPVEISRLRQGVVGFDVDQLSAKNVRTSLVSRRAYRGPIARVTLDSGLTLAVTPDHVVLDGDTLTWRKLEDLRPGGTLVAAQRLPTKADAVWLLDIVPDDWIVGLAPVEKKELSEELVRIHGSTGAAARRYRLRKDALVGRGALRVYQLRQILLDTGLYERWRSRPLGFGRSAATERLKIARITPELAYVLGFALGDGTVRVSPRRSSMSIFQSARNLRQIRQLLALTKTVTKRPWGMHHRVTHSAIRGRPTRSRGYH